MDSEEKFYLLFIVKDNEAVYKQECIRKNSGYPNPNAHF